MSDVNGANEERVGEYPDPVRKRKRLELVTYEYDMPFNYENIAVKRPCFPGGKEFHGVELHAVNSIGPVAHHYPADTIEISEDHPIVRVAVIGSACSPPGWIQLEADPLDSFYRSEHQEGATAARFRAENLWGKHLRVDQYIGKSGTPIKDKWDNDYPALSEELTEIYPHFKKGIIKGHYREDPLTGMSSAVFEIPPSMTVRITGGSAVLPWTDDTYPDDLHYSFRIIRTTVRH